MGSFGRWGFCGLLDRNLPCNYEAEFSLQSREGRSSYARTYFLNVSLNAFSGVMDSDANMPCASLASIA